MPIQANVTNNQIMASVGETQIDVSVSGGVGPTGTSGAAATVAVGTVTTGAPGSSASVVNAGSSSAAVLNFTIPAGATGATGAQGPVGPAGTTTWAGITDKPSTFAPSAHKTSHATGGSDALTPADIGAAAVSHAHTVADITGFSEAAQAATAQRASRLGRNPYYYIPTENEWYKAAYYSPALNSGSGGYYTYATQSNTAPGNVVGSSANQANYYTGAGYSVTQSSSYSSSQNYLTDVGAFTNSASFYGTFDQTGNAWEWNDLDGAAGPVRSRRGGNWGNADAFNLSSANRYADDPSNEFYGVGFRLASPLNPLSLSNFVTVGNPGNANDSTGYGGVGYTYQIAKYELTNTEYCEFLNAVAATDTYGLFNSGMAITRSGSSGSYTYAPSSGNGNKPVIYITWFRAARYCNWLTNGKPSGSQTVFTTEDGAYTLNGATSGSAPSRNALVTSVAGRTGSVTIGVSDITGLATVATSGSAADLSGTLNAARLPATTVSAGSYGSASSVATYTVDATGRLTSSGSTAIAISAGAVSGLASVATSGSYNDLSNKPTIPSAYTLPTASASVLGGVKIGSGITIDGNGVISASRIELPMAFPNSPGVVLAGTGINVSSSPPGTISVSYGTTSGTACQGNDSRLSDAREWSASTIDQAEAEAGTATTRRAFTAQRVFQAIAAWWNASAAKTKLDGIASGATANATDAQLRDRATHTGTQAWSTIVSTPTTLSGYGITDAVTTSDSRLSDSRTPLSHAHGNITNAGTIGSTSGQIVVTTTGGLLTTAATISSAAVSGLAASATTDTTNASNLSSGTLSASRLPASGVTAGTYTSISVDSTGRVTAGSNPTSGVKLGLILALQ